MLSSVATDLFQSLLATQKGDEDCPHHAESHLSNLIESTASRLRRIVDELSAIREAREQGGMAPSTVQKGSEVAGVLSLDHMRAVYTAIELLWSTALKPFAVERLPFLTASESRLNYPRTLVIRQNTLNNLSKTCLNLSESDIWNIYSIIFDVIFCPSFSSTMYKRFIKRIVLVHVLLSREESERAIQCSNMLQQGLTRAVDEECFRQFVIAIREYMHECGNSQLWLLQDGGRLLSEYILHCNGLKYVLQGYLDGTFADRDADIIQEKVAHTVTSVPSKISKADYFKLLCPQVMDLLISGYSEKDNMLMQVCSKICNRLAIVTPILFKRTILMPIVQPLLMIGGSIFSDGGAIVAQETDIARATELPLQLLSSSPPSPQLLTLLQQTGYIYPIISLHSYLATKALSSGLMASCRDVCKFLMERDPAIPGIAGDLIRAMLFEPPRKFCLGNSGGIEIREKGAKSDDDGYTMLLGGIKSQLSSLLPASASDITKESFEQMLSLCMEQSDQSFAVNELSGDRYKNVNSFKSSSISRALEIAHSFELISSCSKDQGGTADASGNAISSLLSDIFLQSMVGYFDFKSNESDCASGAASSSSAVGGVSTSVDREQHGIILLALQSTLPTTLLLADGIKIIQLLKLVIEAQAAKIANRDIYSASTFDTDIAVVTTRPLIEVVSSTAADSVLEFGSKVVDYAEEIDINNECDNIVTPVTDTRTNEDDRDFLNTALSVLTAMLAFGSSGRSEAEETALRALLPALQRISAMELDVSVSEKATDLAVAIMTRSVTTKTLAIPCDQKSADVLKATSICSAGINNPVGKAELTMIDLCASVSKEFLHDEHPAMRALGLRQISNALKRKEGIKEKEIEALIDVLVSMLEDNDSFVYLSAVHTLRAMFDHSSGYLIVHLMQLFENSDSWAKYDHSTRQSTVVVNITRKRVLLAESIMFGVIRAGATIPLYAGEIINGCMRVIRAENSISRPVVLHISKWDMQKMTLREEQQQDDTTSLSLRRVKKQTDAGQEAEHVDSILLRQSALSLMAEVVSIAGYGSSRYLNEVIQLAVDVLSVEHSSANAAISMRRSAIFMIKHIICGLQQKVFFMKDSGIFLKSAYSRIKIACHDDDKIVRNHAQMALFALNKHTKQQLFFGEEGGIEADIIPPLRILH